jgi:hypothetical protein
MLGLTGAFLAAGSRAVVASLWDVDDAATATFMRRFYAALARGRTAAGALAAARRDLARSAPTAAPFYWSGFVVVGDGRLQAPLERRLPAALAFVAAGAAVVAAALLLVLGFRRAAPLVSLGVAWAAVSYLPFANLFFPTGVLFTERLLYAPSAGAVLAVAGGLVALGSWRGTAAARGAALLAVAALALFAVARLEGRLPEWRDDRTLFQAAVRDLPGNGRAWMNLAVLALSDGDASSAERNLTAALRADPLLRGSVASMRDHARTLGRPELVAAIDAALASSR